jgi:outer membrane lipoprotein SlyB
MELLQLNGSSLGALNAFWGAGLGASFYILLRTQPYLRDRSYDPRYNAVYISRFITGVIAGVILATAIGPALGKSLTTGAGAALTPGVLAIVGGFAAEAVELVLQRFVEILLAVVRGDGSAEVQTKLSAVQREKNAKVEDRLTQAQAAAAQGNMAAVQDALDKARSESRKVT